MKGLGGETRAGLTSRKLGHGAPSSAWPGEGVTAQGTSLSRHHTVRWLINVCRRNHACCVGHHHILIFLEHSSAAPPSTQHLRGPWGFSFLPCWAQKEPRGPKAGTDPAGPIPLPNFLYPPLSDLSSTCGFYRTQGF